MTYGDTRDKKDRCESIPRLLKTGSMVYIDEFEMEYKVEWDGLSCKVRDIPDLKILFDMEYQSGMTKYPLTVYLVSINKKATVGELLIVRNGEIVSTATSKEITEEARL